MRLFHFSTELDYPGFETRNSCSSGVWCHPRWSWQSWTSDWRSSGVHNGSSSSQPWSSCGQEGFSSVGVNRGASASERNRPWSSGAQEGSSSSQSWSSVQEGFSSGGVKRSASVRESDAMSSSCQRGSLSDAGIQKFLETDGAEGTPLEVSPQAEAFCRSLRIRIGNPGSQREVGSGGAARGSVVFDWIDDAVQHILNMPDKAYEDIHLDLGEGAQDVKRTSCFRVWPSSKKSDSRSVLLYMAGSGSHPTSYLDASEADKRILDEHTIWRNHTVIMPLKADGKWDAPVFDWLRPLLGSLREALNKEGGKLCGFGYSRGASWLSRLILKCGNIFDGVVLVSAYLGEPTDLAQAEKLGSILFKCPHAIISSRKDDQTKWRQWGDWTEALIHHGGGQMGCVVSDWSHSDLYYNLVIRRARHNLSDSEQRELHACWSLLDRAMLKPEADRGHR